MELDSAGFYFLADVFGFGVVRDVETGALQTSGTITIDGFVAQYDISIKDGEYSIGCDGTFVSEAGVIKKGETLCVRHTSSETGGTVQTIITLGKLVTVFASVTKQPKSSGGGSMPIIGLIFLLSLAFARKFKQS